MYNLSIKICDIDLMTVEKSEDYPMFMGYCRFSNCSRTIQEAYLFNDLSQFLALKVPRELMFC